MLLSSLLKWWQAILWPNTCRTCVSTMLLSLPLQWSSLNALAVLPSLVELKFKDNPLLQGKIICTHDNCWTTCFNVWTAVVLNVLFDQRISDCRRSSICCKTAGDCQNWTANLIQQQSCKHTVTHPPFSLSGVMLMLTLCIDHWPRTAVGRAVLP